MRTLGSTLRPVSGAAGLYKRGIFDGRNIEGELWRSVLRNEGDFVLLHVYRNSPLFLKGGWGEFLRLAPIAETLGTAEYRTRNIEYRSDPFMILRFLVLSSIYFFNTMILMYLIFSLVLALGSKAFSPMILISVPPLSASKPRISPDWF